MAKKESDLGINVERSIISFLNKKKIYEIEDSRLKNLIKEFASKHKLKGENHDITCKKYVKRNLLTKGNPKIDLTIGLNRFELNISIKSGQGNSLHEEPEDTFLNFLVSLKFSDEDINFISKHLKEPIDIRNSNIPSLFKKNKKKIIQRVLNGRFHTNESEVDYYYAIKTSKNLNLIDYQKNIIDGYYASKDDVFNYMLNQDNKKNSRSTTCDVGILTYQSYNRNKGQKPQFKWGNPYTDLKKISEENEK